MASNFAPLEKYEATAKLPRIFESLSAANPHEPGVGEFARVTNVRREIEVERRAVLQLRVKIPGRAVADLHGDARMALSEGSDHSRQHVDSRGRAGADEQRAAPKPLELADDLAGAAERGEDPLGVVQQEPPRIREVDVPTQPIQEPDVELVEPSSWSCVHGVERWRSACGCKIEPSWPTQQEWRAVLRDALDGLAEGLHPIFEREAGALLRDPWAALAEYGEAQGAGEDARAALVERHGARRLDASEKGRALELLDEAAAIATRVHHRVDRSERAVTVSTKPEPLPVDEPTAINEPSSVGPGSACVRICPCVLVGS